MCKFARLPGALLLFMANILAIYRNKIFILRSVTA